MSNIDNLSFLQGSADSIVLMPVVLRVQTVVREVFLERQRMRE